MLPQCREEDAERTAATLAMIRLLLQSGADLNARENVRTRDVTIPIMERCSDYRTHQKPTGKIFVRVRLHCHPRTLERR